jgi:hypothetical protein
MLLESDRVREAYGGLEHASAQFANAGTAMRDLTSANEQLATRVDALVNSVEGINGSVANLDSPRDLINRALIGGGVIAFASVAGAVGGAMIVLRRLNRDGGQRPGARGSA